jgi:phytoene dehydrogenase-like protein
MVSNGGGGWWLKAARETGAAIRWECLPNTAVYIGGKIAVIPYCSTGAAFVNFIKDFAPIPIPEASLKELEKVFDEAQAMSEEKLWSVEMDTKPFRAWIDKITGDELARRILALFISAIIVVPPEYCMEFASVTGVMGTALAGLMGGRTNLTCVLGDASDAIPKAFCDVVTKHGGQVLTNHEVTRVIIEGDQVRGVAVRNSKGVEDTYQAELVVMGSGYPAIPSLLGENLPREIGEIIKGFDATHRDTSIDVHYVLKRKVVNAWWSQLMVSNEKLEYRGMILAPSFFEPKLAPPGKQFIMAEKFMTISDFKAKPKEKWVQELTDIVEEVFPGFKAEIEMTHTHVVSPAVGYFWKPGPKIPLECPGISGLYFTGDCTQAPGIGTEHAASTAMTVAKTILRRKGKLIG